MEDWLFRSNFGSLIVVAIQDRKSRIETSNNTAIRITDYQTKQLLAASRTDFKTGDYGKGILAIAKGLDNQFYRGSGTFPSDDSSEIKRYSDSISGKKSSRNSSSNLVIVRTVTLWTMCSESG